MNEFGNNFISSTADLRNITAIGFLKPHLDQQNSQYFDYYFLQSKIDVISKQIFEPIRKYETSETGDEIELGEYTIEDFQKKCVELKERYQKIVQEFDSKINIIFHRPEFLCTVKHFDANHVLLEERNYYQPGREGCRIIIHSLFGGKEIVDSFPMLGDNPIRDNNQTLLLSSPVTRDFDQFNREKFYIKHNDKEYSKLYEKYDNSGIWILCSTVIPDCRDTAVMADNGVHNTRALFHLMNIIDDLFQCRKKSFNAIFNACRFPNVINNLVMEYFG